MQRILEDYLQIPVYLLSSTAKPESLNVNIVIRIEHHREPVQEYINANDASPVGGFTFKEYPRVDLQLEISGLVLRDLERVYPTPDNSLDEHGYFSLDVYEQKTKEYDKQHSALRRNLAGTIYGMWQREVNR